MDRQQLMHEHKRRMKLKIFAELPERTPNPVTGHLDPITAGSFAYGDLPIVEPDDLDLLDDHAYQPPPPTAFQAACRGHDDKGEPVPASTVQSMLDAQASQGSSQPTPASLHNGLVFALRGGNVEAAKLLLDRGAPIVRLTPDCVLQAPVDQRIPLFELLLAHGWTPNTPGYYGRVLVTDPVVIADLPLLRWFLSHGANPNLAAQRYNKNRNGMPDSDACLALETAAARGSVEAVQLLLQAGANMDYGNPLHRAAGAVPADAVSGQAAMVPLTKDFDRAMIPVMEVLVAAGADVNKRETTRYMTVHYPLAYAVEAGAIERARWLLEHGADRNLAGPFGSPVDLAKKQGSDEMQALLLGNI